MPKIPPPIRPKWDKPGKPKLRWWYKKRRPGGEHLTEEEMERVMKAAGEQGRHGHRDKLMIRLAYMHGLRVSELVSLRWEHINFTAKPRPTIWCERVKGSISGPHPLTETEIRALKKLSADRRGYVFQNERGGPLSESGFQKIVLRAGEKADLSVPIHPHMLRHSCGYKLINQGTDLRTVQVWLGHANVQNTVGYTHLSTTRLEGLWKD